MVRKPTVRFTGMSVYTLHAIWTAELKAREHGLEFRITSCVDGKHSENSLHYRGDAVDGTLFPMPNRVKWETIVGELIECLGPEFDIVLETAHGGRPSHIHIEFQPSYSARERIRRPA